MFYHEHCSNDYAILCLFVDDFSITSTRLSTKSRDNFFKHLTTTFKTSQADDNNVYMSAFAAANWLSTYASLIKNGT